jgi:hypothetical protein
MIPSIEPMAAGSRVRSLAGAILRANPDLRFVPAKEIGWVEQTVAGSAAVFSGALRPERNRWIGVRAVDSLAASLFKALRRPRRLPAKFADLFGDRVNHELAALILDGVVEIEQGGRFVLGADAHALVFGATSNKSAIKGVTGRLSVDALRYAASLPALDAERLAMRMYGYNRAPATPAWRRRLSTSRASEAFLDIAPGCAGRVTIDRGWRPTGLTKDTDAWSFWSPRDPSAESLGSGPTYKIFISPTLNSTPEAFRVVVKTLLDAGAPPFKFGAGLYGLLRPDKIVAYFRTKGEMLACGTTLCRALDGLPAQGVPFSAELGADGLVSWGIDPQGESLSLANRGSGSWRIWVTSRLARSLLIAKHAEAPTPARAVACRH